MAADASGVPFPSGISGPAIHEPGVLFPEAYDEYTIKAFEAHAVDYLLKPFGKNGLIKPLKNGKSNALQSKQKATLLLY
ncbi:MAG TPA: hypothetical protein VF411_06950 [Bacteroidia bacterium]